MIPEEKQRLRRRMKQLLREMSAEERRRQSAGLVTMLLDRREFREAQRVFAFHPLPSEPDILEVISPPQELFLPKCEGNELRFFPVFPEERLGIGAFGIPEPEGVGECVFPVVGDVVLVPGIAFDPSGRRLGRGGGFYDRFLSELSRIGGRENPPSPFAGILVFGVCFSCQMVSEVPVEAHDISLTTVLAPEPRCL